jgi:hypothetical protein
MRTFSEYFTPTKLKALGHQSIYRGVPIEHVPELKLFLRFMRAAGFLKSVARVRYMYRGPRHGESGTTRLRYAKTVSVYFSERA